MIYSRDFYYNEKEGRTKYTTIPTGNLDVDRFVKKLPAWKEPSSLSNHSKKKTLILADWTLNSMSDEELAKVVLVLKQLLNDEFTVYLWQGGPLRLLTETMLNNLDPHVEFMSAAFPSEIQEAVEHRLHLRPDQIHILDRREMAKLCYPDEKLSGALKLSALLKNYSFRQDRIMKVELEEKLEHIINDDVSDESKNWLENHRQSLERSNITISNSSITRLNVKGLDKLSLLQSWSQTLKELNITAEGEKTLLINRLTDEKKDEKNNLILLKTLNLIMLHNKETDYFLENTTAPTLNTLRISVTSIKNEIFFSFLKKTKHFKKLHLSTFSMNSYYEEINLPELEEIEIRHGNISFSVLHALIKSSKKLKKIKLGNLNSESKNNLITPTPLFREILQEVDLTNLEELMLGSQLNEVFFPAELPNLKILELNNITGFNSLKKCDFPKLEELAISNCNLQDLNDLIIKQSPYLKKLRLKRVNAFKFTSNFPLLEEIDLSILFQDELLWGFEEFEVIFKQAPSLKKINLSGHRDLIKVLLEPDIDLSQIEELVLGRCLITSEFLQNLLKKAPNLKKLSLYNCKKLSNIAQDIEKGLINFSRLEELEVSMTDISDSTLSKLKRPGLTIRADFRGPNKSVTHGPAADPVHKAEEMKEFKSTNKEEFEFKYQGINKTKNQGMIIEKLCQFLKLKNDRLDLIPKIQDGICNPLSRFFLELGPDEWEQFVTTVSEWDGTSAKLKDSLSTYFDKLLKITIAYQSNIFDKKYFLGAPSCVLDYLKLNRKPCMLANPWHAIALYPDDKDNNGWIVYDPNFIDGAKKVSSENLKTVLQTALGILISVRTNQAISFQPKIKDGNSFFKNGGLLALCQSDNRNELLKQLIPNDFNQVSNEGLEGLWLRNIESMPAWTVAITHENSKIVSLTMELLNQYKVRNPQDFMKEISRSLNALPLIEQSKFLEELSKKLNRFNSHPVINSETKNVSEDRLQQLAVRLKAKADYEKQLQTWQKQKPVFDSVTAYCKDLVKPEPEKVNSLIELTSSTDVNALQLQLQKHCLRIKRPVFYINSPEDLVCSAPTIENKGDNRGYLKSGPGGRLHDFLQKNVDPDNPPILVVNYDNFDDDDLVRFNSLLDKDHREADGSPLPDKMIIVGLINIRKPNCYQGSDFYSRFDRAEQCSLSTEKLHVGLSKLPISDEKRDGIPSINLYQGSDWKDNLLGRWMLDEKGLYFEKGELAFALEKGSHVEIQQGLWNDTEFNHFWEQAFLHGEIQHSGGIIKLPKEFSIIRKDGYHWETLLSEVTFDSSFSEDGEILNSGLLNRFFSDYKCKDSQLINNKPGLIQQYANKELHVNVTSELSEHQWAKLLTVCKQHNVNLTIHYPSEMIFPDSFQKKPSEAKAFVSHPPEKTEIIISNDMDASVEMLVQNDDSFVVIDVTGCEPSDLLKRINTLSDNPETFRFEEVNGALLTTLKAKQKVILKGQFSPLLVDSLMPLLLKKRPEDLSSQLTLVSDNNSLFKILPVTTHQISKEEKLDLLEKEFSKAEVDEITNLAESEPLCKLKARVLHKRAFQLGDPWQGLKTLPIEFKLPPLDEKMSEKETEEFIEGRRIAVNKILEHSPYVYLTGLSGVGKSTFVEKELYQSKNDILLIGEEKIAEWAKKPLDGQRKLLFIDEANLSERQWQEFEGLFHKKPSILINGQRHELTSQHKVIFAGNPVSYGDERRLAPLFERHGNALIFEPLPPAFIHEKIIKPVFENTLIAEHANKISDIILKVYQFLCEYSKDEVLISSRELQMMALLILSHCSSHPEQINNIDNIARYYVYHLAKHLVPPRYCDHFDKKFKVIESVVKSQVEQPTGDFCVTASRIDLYNQLQDWLSLREMKQTEMTNDAQKYGGLGGLVIEGSPGAGKSEMVIKTLVGRGYEELRWPNRIKEEKEDKKYFYRMPVSLSITDKKELLLHAFHNGLVVVVDEINSSPMMERLLNSLLMGKTPEGERPHNKPGFMVIGTQNPVTMAGRRAASTALRRRLQTITLPDYTASEMQEILIAKKIGKEQAELMVEVYESQLAKAKQHHWTPLPTFRDLLNVADNYLHSKKSDIISPPSAKEVLEEEKKEEATESKEDSAQQQYPVLQQDSVTAKEIKDLLEKYITNFNNRSTSGFFSRWRRKEMDNLSTKIKNDGLDSNEIIKEVNRILKKAEQKTGWTEMLLRPSQLKITCYLILKQLKAIQDWKEFADMLINTDKQPHCSFWAGCLARYTLRREIKNIESNKVESNKVNKKQQ